MLQVLQLLWNTAESKNFFGRKEFLSGTLFRWEKSAAGGWEAFAPPLQTVYPPFAGRSPLHFAASSGKILFDPNIFASGGKPGPERGDACRFRVTVGSGNRPSTTE
jgi:hypothetical protein